MKRLWPHVLGYFCLCISIHATDGGYGPIFKETGFHANGGYLDTGPDITVNHYGGNVILSNTDVSLPSSGDFGLFFNRTYNSNYAYDPELGQPLGHDSPMGQGWLAHFGVLYPNNGYRPTLVTPSGGREVFYNHDYLTNQIPFVGSSPKYYISPSMSILYEVASDNIWWLLRADGVAFAFSSHNNKAYVPIVVFDLFLNRWDIFYDQSEYDFDDGVYTHHPKVNRVVDGYGRILEFEYGQKLNGRDRLTGISFDNRRLASFEYQTGNGYTYLWRHHTGEGRTTTYATNTSGLVTSITYPTGGQVSFQYQQKTVSYFPGSARLIQALSSITQKGVTRTYTYPTGSPTDTWTVTETGTDGETRDYSFHHYGSNPCAGNLYRMGKISAIATTRNGQTSLQTFAYAPYRISNDLQVDVCSAERVTIPLQTSSSVLIDGQTLTTNYIFTADSLGFPVRITTPQTRTELDWRHLAYLAGNQIVYRLGLPDVTETFFDGVRIDKTDWRYNTPTALVPASVRIYSESADYDTINLGWYAASPTSGVLASRNYDGQVVESYQYNYGSLSRIDYGGNQPPMIRSINRDGTVNTETIGGITSTFAWDHDFRLTGITRPDTATTSIVYDANSITVTSDGSRRREIYDAYGRLSRTEADLEGSYDQVSTRIYDARNRITSETLSSGQTYTMTYDVYDRIKTRNSALDRYAYAYGTDAEGKTAISMTHNDAVTTTTTTDALGRSVFGNLDGHTASMDYVGNHATISPNLQPTREVDLDFRGRKTREAHPESGTATYTYKPWGPLETINRASGIFTQTYDTAGRPDQYKKGTQILVDFDYHITHGRINKLTHRDTQLETTLYDDAARPTRGKHKAPYFPPTVAPQYPQGNYPHTQMVADQQFRWAAVAGSSSYEFQLTNGTQTRSHASTGTSVSFADLKFVPASDFFCQWRVRAINAQGIPGGWSPWQNVSMFTGTTCGTICSATQWHAPQPTCYGSGNATVGDMIRRFNNLFMCPDGITSTKKGEDQ